MVCRTDPVLLGHGGEGTGGSAGQLPASSATKLCDLQGLAEASELPSLYHAMPRPPVSKAMLRGFQCPYTIRACP